MSADDRPRVALNGKQINLAQLAAEVGVALVASDSEVAVADTGTPVTTAQLLAAVTAHHAAAAPVVTAVTDSEVVARVQAVYDDPEVDPSVKKLAAALLGLDGT